jgi:protein required for attachment to host cells
MATTWVLVADASCAQLYRQEATGGLEMFMEFDHPESRMKGDRLASDRPGRQQSKGTGHGTFSDKTTLKQQEAERFARELAETIERARQTNAIGEIIIAAPPHFSGLLNGALSKHARELVTANIEKDYTKLNPGELQMRLAEHGPKRRA